MWRNLSDKTKNVICMCEVILVITVALVGFILLVNAPTNDSSQFRVGLGLVILDIFLAAGAFAITCHCCGRRNNDGTYTDYV
jgi:hypothetical protein